MIKMLNQFAKLPVIVMQHVCWLFMLSVLERVVQLDLQIYQSFYHQERIIAKAQLITPRYENYIIIIIIIMLVLTFLQSYHKNHKLAALRIPTHTRQYV